MRLIVFTVGLVLLAVAFPLAIFMMSFLFVPLVFIAIVFLIQTYKASKMPIKRWQPPRF